MHLWCGCAQYGLFHGDPHPGALFPCKKPIDTVFKGYLARSNKVLS